jgi:putative hydrolase of the HAD superfamily
LKEIRLVVLDLDDTLFLERDYVRSGFQAVGDLVHRNLGVRGFFREAWDLFESGRRDLLFNRVLEARGIEPRPSVIRSLLTRYRTHDPVIRLSPDARRFLDGSLRRLLTGVITDGRLLTQRAKVRALGLRGKVGAIQYTRSLGTGYAKPHPRAFRLMQKRFGVPASACLYVGDNPAKDFVAPAQLGWASCRIRRPGGMFENQKSHGIPVISSFDELPEKYKLVEV